MCSTNESDVDAEPTNRTKRQPDANETIIVLSAEAYDQLERSLDEPFAPNARFRAAVRCARHLSQP